MYRSRNVFRGSNLHVIGDDNRGTFGLDIIPFRIGICPGLGIVIVVARIYECQLGHNRIRGDTNGKLTARSHFKAGIGIYGILALDLEGRIEVGNSDILIFGVTRQVDRRSIAGSKRKGKSALGLEMVDNLLGHFGIFEVEHPCRGNRFYRAVAGNHEATRVAVRRGGRFSTVERIIYDGIFGIGRQGYRIGDMAFLHIYRRSSDDFLIGHRRQFDVIDYLTPQVDCKSHGISGLVIKQFESNGLILFGEIERICCRRPGRFVRSDDIRYFAVTIDRGSDKSYLIDSEIGRYRDFVIGIEPHLQAPNAIHRLYRRCGRYGNRPVGINPVLHRTGGSITAFDTEHSSLCRLTRHKIYGISRHQLVGFIIYQLYFGLHRVAGRLHDFHAALVIGRRSNFGERGGTIGQLHRATVVDETVETRDSTYRQIGKLRIFNRVFVGNLALQHEGDRQMGLDRAVPLVAIQQKAISSFGKEEPAFRQIHIEILDGLFVLRGLSYLIQLFAIGVLQHDLVNDTASAKHYRRIEPGRFQRYAGGNGHRKAEIVGIEITSLGFFQDAIVFIGRLSVGSRIFHPVDCVLKHSGQRLYAATLKTLYPI